MDGRIYQGPCESRPAEVLIVIPLDKTPISYRRELAADPTTYAATLTHLATARGSSVRALVAANPATPADALHALCADPAPDVVRAALTHPHIDPADLQRLAKSSRTDIRAAVAMHPNTPAEVLADIAVSDKIQRVRRIARANPSLPDHIKAFMALSL